MGSFIPNSNFDQIKDIVTSTNDFIRTSSVQEIKMKLPELKNVLIKMSGLFLEKFPLKRELREIAFEFKDRKKKRLRVATKYPNLTREFLFSKGDIDFALDYRMVDYENTDGFAEKGWVIAEEGPTAGFPTGAVKGFGWKNINILSVGLQYKGIKKLPLRVGYTYSSNPIEDELAFFSIPATAVIANAFQLGFSYPITDNFMLNGVYHYGASDGKTEGPMLNPNDISSTNPYGAISGSKVGYEMTTSMVMFGVSYTFKE